VALDILLSTITLLVAVIGTLLKKPPTWAKVVLIALAILSTTGSVIKIASDQVDKNFMKTALTSVLVPSNPTYQRFYDLVEGPTSAKGFDSDLVCHHQEQGMVCFLSNELGDRHATIVFNKVDIAELYAQDISKTNPATIGQDSASRFVMWCLSAVDSKHERDVVGDLLEETVIPKDMEEGFMDKVGVLGYGVFFNMFGRWPTDYNYDPKIGVQVTFVKDGH
jgi:hypothetical protein